MFDSSMNLRSGCLPHIVHLPYLKEMKVSGSDLGYYTTVKHSVHQATTAYGTSYCDVNAVQHSYRYDLYRRDLRTGREVQIRLLHF